MKCPHCEAENADGKNFCADCGALLNLQLQSLRDLIRSQVEDSIQEQFKDQRVVEIETTEAIASRFRKWGTLFLFCVGIPLALLGLTLALLGVTDYKGFRDTVHRATSELNPKLDQAIKEADTARNKAVEAERKTDEAAKSIDAAIAKMDRQLASVERLSDKVSGAEQQTETKIISAGNRIGARMEELDTKVETANREIVTTQNKLTSTSELVKALFEAGQTEFFQTAVPDSKLCVVPQSPKGARVYMLLKSAAIFQTVQLQWHIYTQPKYSLRLTNANVLIFFWGDPAESLNQYPLAVSYVPDPTYHGALSSSLSVKDGHVYADNVELPENIGR